MISTGLEPPTFSERGPMGLNVTKNHSFTVRKLIVECIPHLTVVSLYLIIAEGYTVLSEMFPLLFIGLGILSSLLSKQSDLTP